MALTQAQRDAFYLVNRAVSNDPVFAASVSEAALALHMSHEGLRGKLYLALQTSLDLTADKWWNSDLYIRDTFDNNVVYHYDGKEWRQSYTMNGDEPVLQGKPTLVELSYVDLATESATAQVQEGRALEIQYFGHAREDHGEGSEGLVRVIAAGQGSSGYYPKEVLKRDGPKVFTKGLHMFWNHATETMDEDYPVGDLNRQAGVLTGNAYWDESGPVGPGLYAPYHAFEEYKPRIAERVKHNAVQISWKGFMGYTEGQVGGKVTRIVQSLNRAESVDFVTLAGAGGAIARASESAASRRMENNVALVQVEDTELNRLKALESAANENAARLTAASKALKTARESAATAIINNLFGTKQIPDSAKEQWRGLCMDKVDAHTKDEVLDTAAFESFVKGLISPLPDVKAAESTTPPDTAGTAASEAARVNLGGGGITATGMDSAKVRESLVQHYMTRGFSKERAEQMARG